MPHQKNLSYPTLPTNLLSKLTNAIIFPVQKSLSTIAIIQKRDSGYKRHHQKREQSRQNFNLFYKQSQKHYPKADSQKQENRFSQIANSLPTFQPQIPLLLKKKQQKLAYYQRKYKQQINNLSSNLTIRQVEKQFIPQTKNQRKTSFLKSKKDKRNFVTQSKDDYYSSSCFNKNSFKKLHPSSIIKIDQNYQQFKNKYFQRPSHKKLKFQKLKPLKQQKIINDIKPLIQLKNMDISPKIKYSMSFERSSIEKPYFPTEFYSQFRGADSSSQKHLMEQLINRQQINPWNYQTFQQQENQIPIQ